MPTSTYYNLKEDKKNRIELAIKKEFSRAPLGEMSVKNIVTDSKIARGSFYQYFESKEDVIDYIINKEFEKELKKMSRTLDANNRDIFKCIPLFYDLVLETRRQKYDFYLNIAPYMTRVYDQFVERVSEDEVVGSLYLEKYEVKNIKVVLKMLLILLFEAMYSTINGDVAEEEARKILIEQIEIISKGLEKK